MFRGLFFLASLRALPRGRRSGNEMSISHTNERMFQKETIMFLVRQGMFQKETIMSLVSRVIV